MICCTTSTILSGRFVFLSRSTLLHGTLMSKFVQVISSNASIAILSKPCAACTSRSQSFHDSEGKSDNSRSSSRRGSNTMPCGDSSRRNSSVNQQLYGVSADMTPALLPMSQNQSPVYLSPEHTSIPSHTIVAASLRASTRKSVAIQANGWLEHVGESSIGAGKDALQVVVSVKDRYSIVKLSLIAS
jgi:hypothetical protein